MFTARTARERLACGATLPHLRELLSNNAMQTLSGMRDSRR